MLKLNTIKVSLEAGIARVDLNRPDKGNSLDAEMWRELRTALEQMDEMSAARVVVLGGTGKHFSTGIDLSFLAEMQQQFEKRPRGQMQEALRDVIVTLQESVNAIERCRKPVLAAIQGFCLGAGVDIVCACDMRCATGTARFSIKEVDMAIVADLGSLQRLPRIVGEGIARELAFTGRTFKGEEALRFGFLNRLFKNGTDLEEGVAGIASDLAAKSPATLRGIKETMNFSRDHGVADGLVHVAQRNAAMLFSRDLDEALKAYQEQRAPQFSDD